MKKILDFFVGNNDTPLRMQYTGVIRFIPLILAGGFFFATILLHAFGPTNWNIHNPEKLYPFLIACLFALILGYTLAVFKTKTQDRSMNLNIGRILLVGAVVFLILFFPLCRLTTGKWFPDVYLGITNTGAAYQLTKYYSKFSHKLFFYLRIIFSPFIFVVMPLTLFFFPKLTRTQKCFGIAVISLNVALGIAQGVNKHVADIVMQLVLLLAILFFSKGKETKRERVFYRIRVALLILVLCVGFILYFSNSMENRIASDIQLGESGSQSSSQEDLEDILSQKPHVDDESITEAIGAYSNFSVGEEKSSAFWNAVIPPRVKPIITYMISYFCHGYNGLSYAMEEDFTSSYGLGFSEFIRHNAARFFGGAEFENAIYERTYMGKIEEQGWQTGAVWSSFFICPASDISFIGTVFLICLIGFLFGLSWKDTVTTQNPFACAAFYGFTIMVFYFSANNQMFQSGETCVAFCVTLLAWFISRTVHAKAKK